MKSELEELGVSRWWVFKRFAPIAALHTVGIAAAIWLMSALVSVDPFIVFLGGFLAGGMSVSVSIKEMLRELWPPNERDP